MKSTAICLAAVLPLALGCSRDPGATSSATPVPANGQQSSVVRTAAPAQVSPSGEQRGFDRNDYPGDDLMARMRTGDHAFAFTGYWLTNPPGETTNSWTGKRQLLLSQGWGFLVLANGRLDAEILKAQKSGTRPVDLGHQDAAAVVLSARREGFPGNTILFLDQEEGGRLLPEQAAYLLAWTEAVAAHGFRPGVYASGQAVADSPGVTIDTIQDIRARVQSGHLHPVAIFDALDQCPPAPGCTLKARPLRVTPDADILAWQYAQSPRRPEITRSCGETYAADGNCYAPGFPTLFLDLDVANDADPSHGR